MKKSRFTDTTTLAFVIVGTILSNPAFAIPATIYSLIMYLSSGTFIWVTRQTDKAELAHAEST